MLRLPAGSWCALLPGPTGPVLYTHYTHIITLLCAVARACLTSSFLTMLYCCALFLSSHCPIAECYCQGFSDLFFAQIVLLVCTVSILTSPHCCVKLPGPSGPALCSYCHIAMNRFLTRIVCLLMPVARTYRCVCGVVPKGLLTFLVFFFFFTQYGV